MNASGVVVRHLRTGGIFVQCASSAECQRIMDQYMAHWRLVWLYLPIAVLALLVVPGLVVLGRRLRTTTYRRHQRQRLQVLLLFAGVIVMAAIAAPLFGLIHLWAVDAILSGLVLWGFGSIAILAKMRLPPDRRG